MRKSFRAFEQKTPNELEVITPSAEAKICLECDPNENCKGNCNRYKQEKQKLKDKK